MRVRWIGQVVLTGGGEERWKVKRKNGGGIGSVFIRGVELGRVLVFGPWGYKGGCLGLSL